jgi:hypothetical protein
MQIKEQYLERSSLDRADRNKATMHNKMPVTKTYLLYKGVYYTKVDVTQK